MKKYTRAESTVTVEDRKPGLLKVPTAAEIHVVKRALYANDGTISQMQGESERDSSKPQIEVIQIPTDKDRAFEIRYAKKNSETVFRFFIPPESLRNENATVVKFLTYLLCKTAEQEVLTSSGLIKDTIILSLNEVCSRFGFASTRTAKQSLESALNLLERIPVQYVKKNDLGRQSAGRSAGVVFNYEEVNKGVYEVLLNGVLPWKEMSKQMAIIPVYAFKLKGRYANFMDYVSYRARQSIKEIEKNGCFYIKAETLRARLNLPEPEKTKQPQRDIRNWLESLVDEIDTYYGENNIPEEERFELIWTRTDYGVEIPIKQYLKEAKLKVTPGSSIIAEYSTMSKKATAKQTALTGRKRGRPPKPKPND